MRAFVKYNGASCLQVRGHAQVSLSVTIGTATLHQLNTCHGEQL
jgi:hypothetical protein